MNPDKLNDRQKEAVCAGDGPILVLAGAGSGKTRVLTQRVAYLIAETGVHPLSILAITFTNKAAAEMRERIRQALGMDVSAMWISTFHSMCVRMLRMHGSRIGYSSGFAIYDSDDSLRVVRQILNDMGLKDDKNYPPKLVRSIVSKYKNTSGDTGIFSFADSAFPMQAYNIEEIYRRYTEELQRQNAMDFDDLLLNALRLLREDEEVLQYYRERFRYVLVDEYQDTNMVQYRLTRLLASKHRNLFVVGDDDQSIYAFRGANIQNILNFEKDYPDAQVIRLEQNYRSDINILKCANDVIQKNHGRTRKTLWSQITGGDKPKLYTAHGDREEAEYIAREIGALVRQGGCYGDIAVLYRQHTLARVIEEKLRMYAIPYRIYGGVSFYERKEVKDLLAYLNLLANPLSDVHFQRIINVPRRGIGDTTIKKIVKAARQYGISCMASVLNGSEFLPDLSRKLDEFTSLMRHLYDSVKTMDVPALMREIYEKSGYREMLITEYPEDCQTRMENVEELINSAYEFKQDGGEGLDGFLQNIALITDLDSMDEGGGVTLMTIHAAKGLEFETVFVAGMEETLFPSRMALDDTAIEEERRLCYVAITRAKKNLYFTHALRRAFYGDFAANPPSRFLAEIDPALLECLGQPAVHSYAKPPDPFRVFSPEWKPQDKKPQKVSDEYKVGMTVIHKMFGSGMITAIAGERDQRVATVNFDSAGIKKMFLGYAALEIKK